MQFLTGQSTNQELIEIEHWLGLSLIARIRSQPSAASKVARVPEEQMNITKRNEWSHVSETKFDLIFILQDRLTYSQDTKEEETNFSILCFSMNFQMRPLLFESTFIRLFYQPVALPSDVVIRNFNLPPWKANMWLSDILPKNIKYAYQFSICKANSDWIYARRRAPWNAPLYDYISIPRWEKKSVTKYFLWFPNVQCLFVSSNLKF